MHTHKPKVAVIGLGYVGYPLAVQIAKAGYELVGVDTDADYLEALGRGEDPRGLIPEEDRIHIPLSTTPPEGFDIYLICVPTPDKDGRPYQAYVEQACDAVGAVLKDGAWVVVESTVIPGSTKRNFKNRIARAKGNNRFNVAYSPERINPGGNAFNDFVLDPKLLGVDAGDPSIIYDMYGHVFNSVVVLPSTEAAELAKCFENAQRDVNIALMNELAMQCRINNIPYDQVVRGLRTKRTSPVFHSGLVGGHCISVDPYYLDYFYGGNALPGKGRSINETFISVVTKEAVAAKGPILIVGKSYKPGVTDTRNSGALAVYNRLQSFGLSCSIHDKLVDGPYDGNGGYEFIVGAVNHDPSMDIAQYYGSLDQARFLNIGGQFADRQLRGFGSVIHM